MTDLTDVPSALLRAELARRDRMLLAGKCAYCGWPLDTHSCRYSIYPAIPETFHAIKESFAHVTTPDNAVDVNMDLDAAMDLAQDGLLAFDGMVEHETSLEYLFTPLPGCIPEELKARGAN